MCCCANVVTPFNLFLIMIVSTCTCSLKERDKTSFFDEVLCDTRSLQSMMLKYHLLSSPPFPAHRKMNVAPTATYNLLINPFYSFL